MINREVGIFTDGACRGNPELGRWGVPISSGKTKKELWGGESDKTNNRTKPTSAIHEIEALNQASTTLLTIDSRYVRNEITQWIKDRKRATG